MYEELIALRAENKVLRELQGLPAKKAVGQALFLVRNIKITNKSSKFAWLWLVQEKKEKKKGQQEII